MVMLHNINEQLVIHLRKLGHTIRYFQDGKGSQNRVLMVLLTHPGMTQQKLTEHLDIKPGSVSELLSKLLKNGFIERQVNSEDRRTSILLLTESGKKKAQMALEKKKETYEMMFACLNEEEKKTLLGLLEKVNQHLSEKRKVEI